jgi:hypothetical protein
VNLTNEKMFLAVFVDQDAVQQAVVFFIGSVIVPTQHPISSVSPRIAGSTKHLPRMRSSFFSAQAQAYAILAIILAKATGSIGF